MKNIYYFKSLFRTSLVALCLLTAEVGQMRAGTRRIYFDYSAVSWWKDYTNLNSGAGFAKVHCWGGNSGDQDYTMSALAGQTDLAYCDIDDGWTNICFFRCGSDGTWWTKTHNYDGIGSNNRFKIKNQADNDEIDKYRWADSGAAIRWVPGVSIDGLVDVHNPHTQAFDFDDNDGTYQVELSAHSTYQFCILDGSTRYTLDNNVWTSDIVDYTLNNSTSDYDIRLTTAGAGTYTFAYNKSTHVISVTYPTVSHPNIDYCYMYGYNDWTNKYLHIWNSSSSIAGTTWPGTEMHNYITISGEKYYYFAPGDYAKSMPNNNNDGQKTSELTNSQGYGKYMKHNGSAWVWNTFTVRIQLENDDATYVGTEYQDIAFNSGVLSDITCPTKTHYDFGGYYTEEGGTGTQVINSEGEWIASVADYTDASKHWIHAGTSTTLYAKWTEHEYDLTINISPTGAGTVSPSPTKVTYVTPTALLTATPSSPAYIFKEWQYSTNVGPYGETGNDNTVQITAAQNGTLTAVFEPRYRLVGSLTDDGDPAGGMPGWTNPDADAKAFTINSISPSVNMTKTCTLNPNSWYKFEIHDKKANKNYGHGNGTYVISGSQSFDEQDRTVLFQTKGRGEYTFTISAITESGDLYYPTVSVSGPTSYQMNLSWADVDIDDNWWKTSRETGGTVAAVATENGSNTAITNGQYVASGGSITYTATPASGYTFAGWWNSDWTYNFANDNPYTSSSIGATENVEGKFIEKSTTVTINANNTAGGTITVNSSAFSWGSTQTAGVTTKRALVVTPNTGYNFTGWTLSNTPDFELQDQANATDPEVTLAGLGGTNGSTGTLTAGFTAKNYTVTLNDDHGGSNNGTATATYASSTLSSKTDATFSGWTLLGYWNNTGVQVINSEGALIASVAGYTDASSNWIYDDNVTLYAHWSRTITLDKKEGSSNGSVTVTYKGTAETPSAPSRTGYSVEGYYAETGLTNKVMNPNGSMVASVSDYTNGSSQWIHNTASTLYTKWTANPYTVTLENQGATSAGTENVSVTYDASTNLTSSITCPTKAHYDFGGYFTAAEGAGTQLINANGSWKASVDGYTGASKEWVYADNITLYAKWTEHEYTITLGVSPAGAGTTSPASNMVGKLVTESGNITATPAAGYKFKEWQFSKTDENYDVYVSDGETYHSTDATIRIKAQHNGTLTAVFEPRYALVGSEYGTSNTKGMPGWEDYTKTFTVNSSSPVNLTKSCTLEAGTTYKFQIHDLADGHNYGAGSDGQYLLLDGAEADFTNQDKDVKFDAVVAGEYIFKITAVDGSGHPTVTILRPHQLHMGHVHAEIDNTSATTSGDTGGTLTASSSGNSLSNNDGFAYNANITYTASPVTGYTATWYSNSGYSSAMDPQPSNSWTNSGVTSDEDIYVRFTETSTSVTLSNDGHGKVQIGGADATSTTCGVTTTRELTAVPNEGYKFNNWTTSASPDFEVASSTSATTTLTGHGAGTAGTLTANFTYRWALSAQSDGWGSSEFIIGNIATVSGDVVGYVDISLAANTNYQFTMKDLLTNDIYKNGSDKVYYMTNGNSSDWPFATDKTYNCGITTAGKGTYRFTWNVTDKTMTVTYPASYQVNYGASVGGSVSVVDDDSNAVPNGGYVRSGGSVTYTATPNTGYTFVGWCGSDAYGDPFTDINPWTNSSVEATSNAYAKFKSTNFVIYRSGDKDDDPRAALDDVESYAGGTISETIEFRMKVRDLDMWHTLCLPFTVSAVQVWDEDDGPAYYDIVPYYRSGGTFYIGHYIIRTPKATTNLSITEFGEWNDPESPTGYKPSKDTPYIIQWHNSYFLNKYVSFFGATGQTIPTSFSAGTAPSSDNVVNVCVNKSMQTGSVAGAYMLESDYGNGAWLRLDNADESRPIPPFECYLLVNNPTRARYMAIRPGMTAADTPTGWDDVVNSEIKTHIIVYSISGVCITQYSNCSINEAGQRLSESYGEGLYILRADNESVKLMVGGK